MSATDQMEHAYEKISVIQHTCTNIITNNKEKKRKKIAHKLWRKKKRKKKRNILKYRLFYISYTSLFERKYFKYIRTIDYRFDEFNCMEKKKKKTSDEENKIVINKKKIINILFVTIYLRLCTTWYIVFLQYLCALPKFLLFKCGNPLRNADLASDANNLKTVSTIAQY